jgi:hypothetical protein
MTSGELATLLSELLEIPFSTVDLYGRRLRAAGMLSVKGHGRGAAQMTPSDVAAWLVALCIEHKRGGDFVQEVRQVLRLPLCETIAIPETIADGLQMSKAKRLGECVSTMMSDVVSARFANAMSIRQDIFTLAFDAEGVFAAASMQNKKIGPDFQSASWTFQRRKYGDRRRRNLERVTAINGVVLFDIARAMGIIPPPPY